MQQSIGDFYVNIVPKLDTISLNTGISAVNSALELAKKGWGGAKGAFGSVLDVAKPLRDLKMLSNETGLSMDKIHLLRRAFEQSGLSADSADESIMSLTKDMADMSLWGEANWKSLSRWGLVPIMLDKSSNQFEKIIKLREKISKLAPNERVDALSALGAGLGSPLSQFIAQSDKDFQTSMANARKIRTPSAGMVNEAMGFLHGATLMSQQFESMKIALISSVIPALNEITMGLTQLFTDKDFVQSLKNLTQVLLYLTRGAVKVGGAAGNILSDTIGKVLFPSQDKRELMTREETLTPELRKRMEAQQQSVNVTVTPSPLFNVEVEKTSRGITREENKTSAKELIESTYAGPWER